ncbi:MAG: hypothetical protein IPJ69_12450 [Deltaproteobacteria bacterium]|nr:MAG: hypothetical protein IPJ69_12450 [Deltaproteobacteria bacterium]
MDNAFEIFGQRLSPSAAPLGSQFKISDMTSSGLATNKDALDPMVIYNEDTDQFFVVWFGDRAVATEYEIYGQIINADTGSLSGENIKISQMGGDGLIAFDATNPAVTYDNLSHSYIVTWTGDEATDFVVDDENEIYTQQVDAVTGLNIETSFRISDMGPDRDPAFDAVFSAIDYSQLSHQALVIWSGHDRADDDFEIFGQVYASFVTASGGSGGGSGGASGDGSGGESAAGSGGDLGAGSGGSSGSGGVTSDASGGVSGSGIETSSGGVSGTGGGGSGGTEPPAAETGGSSGEVGTITGASGSDGTPETLNDSAANGSCGLLPHS